MSADLQEVTINGKWQLKVPSHRVDQWLRPWEVARIESMYQNIRRGDIVYDIGAEQFDMSALFATWGALMVLIEPSKWGWPTGEAIWEANDLAGPMATFHGFAGAEDGQAQDVFLGGNWPPVTKALQINEGEGFAVINQRPDLQRITLDALVAIIGLPPRVITMDVEGAEFEVLQGADRIITEHRPLIYISEHPEFGFTNFGYYQSEMHSWMHARGYLGKFLDMDHEQHWLWYHPEGRQPV